MSSRNLLSWLLIVPVSFTLGARAFAQGEWAVEETFHVGGEGGFDYITADAKNHRLYVPRSTHTMVIDADSGKLVADITGQKHNHGVALVPELGRGFISDGAGSIVIFDLKTNAVLGTVAAKDDTDGIIYDKSTGLVLAASGDEGVLITLKDPAAVTRALGNVDTRIHQDILLSSMMLLPPKNTVILFPATTRYESPGGGTETSTERRIIFSPEIYGRRIGSAKPEWEVFGEVAARVRPELADEVRFESSQQIRDQIGKAVPLYEGIETLSKEGDNFQWGGPRLFSDGKFATDDGKGHFCVVNPEERRPLNGMFYLSTRRGKQFNSMVHRASDPLTGALRDDVLVSRKDLERLGIRERELIRLTSSTGSFVGRASGIRAASVGTRTIP